MIGFKYKNVLWHAILIILAGLWSTACTHLPVGKTSPAEVPAQSGTETPRLTAEPVKPAKPVPVREALTAPVLYDVLLGEIAGQRGRLDVSGSSYLEAARHSNDPRIAERALKISVYAKRPELALEAARRWVELAPDALDAHQSLAVLALRVKHQDEALQQFRYLLKHARGGRTGPYQSLLALLVREPDKQRALDVMQQLVEMSPRDAEAHFAYARLAVHTPDWPVAEREVARALQLKPGWTQAFILRAQIKLKQGKGKIARQQLADALHDDPKNVELRLTYARLLVDLNDYKAARSEYERLLKVRPNNGQVVYSLALLSLQASQLKEAGTLFEKLVNMKYQTQQAYYYLGAIAEEDGKPERAMQWYHKVQPDGDHWIEVQIRMARLEAQSGEVGAARERLRKVRLTHPGESPRLFLVEGGILSQVGRNEEAYKLYSQYLDTQPDNTEILYARALVAEQLNRLKQAERDFRHVLKIDPDNMRTLNALGYTLANRTHRYKEALSYIQKALSKKPDDPAVIDSMGWVLYRLGRLSEAREKLQKAYDMTKDSEIAAHLGEVMWTMGDRDQAKALWQKARKATPDNPILKDTVKRYLH